MQTEARVFYNRFQQAQTAAERDAIAAEFQAIYDNLTPVQRKEAQPVLDEILNDAERILEEVAPVVARAERLLHSKSIAS